MSQKMLIDASHDEETRVVVLESKKVEDFDFESLKKLQLSGNIYLAKVTRVEPSLQAAFLDYGGNRHGFLAFSEIHPDYYQSPLEERPIAVAEDSNKTKSRQISRKKGANVKAANLEAPQSEKIVSEGLTEDNVIKNQIEPQPDPNQTLSEKDHVTDNEVNLKQQTELPTSQETFIKKQHRKFRIQEVIKVRQILLIQIVKEERGNKGAALTTYLSLAGRYCVLMPNTPRGGGISRKITNLADRKKLKDIANSLLVPEGSGLIIRTAGSNRTKIEIKRDYEYLIRQWEQVRDLTLSSIAPTTIYEEGSLIKRAIRDLYSRTIDEILVEGDRGYREAKDYMKMLMPSHAKNVKKYEQSIPLFSKFQVEDHLAAMFNPIAQLRSGGYIVIDVTEALVAVDVNSGRATKESSIEDTALRTNLEAAEELSRQIKLRDLAGLIVIDFIDMEDRKNNIAVEKRMKDRLKNDRARTQVGRISMFGLLEMSRQRLRPGMIETSTQPCEHCHGTGITRSEDSLSLAILRELEEEGLKNLYEALSLEVPSNIANYMLNEKRDRIAIIETRYALKIRIQAKNELISPAYKLEKLKGVSKSNGITNSIKIDNQVIKENESDSEISGLDKNDPTATPETASSIEEVVSDDSQGKRRRRRRRKPKQRPLNALVQSENGNINETQPITNNESSLISIDIADESQPAEDSHKVSANKKEQKVSKRPKTKKLEKKESESSVASVASVASGEHNISTQLKESGTKQKKRSLAQKGSKEIKSTNSGNEAMQAAKARSNTIEEDTNEKTSDDTQKKSKKRGWWSKTKTEES
jgi:ribonuclease E